jgi:hypothetical protein
MTRGMEGKSVKAQIVESSSEPSPNETSSAAFEELQSRLKKKDLLLSRKRVLQQLEGCGSERYSELLHRTLTDLEAQIAAISC